MERPAGEPLSGDMPALARALEGALRLRVSPIGMKLLETAAMLADIPRLRRPSDIHTLDQVVGQAARLGWTVGVTAQDLVGPQCRAVVGLAPADDEWRSGRDLAGVWFATPEDARRHQEAMHCAPHGRHEALVVSPLAQGRVPDPDIVLFYATPGAMIYFINGLQWSGYRRFDWSVVGESSCADSWGRALRTREPSLSIPCFAERRYGGVQDEEMLMALTAQDAWKALTGIQALARNGLRYPFAPYGLQQDARAGMGVSYEKLNRSTAKKETSP